MRGLWQPVRRVGPELIQVAARTRLQLIHIRRSRVRLNTYYDLEIDQFTAGEFPRQAKFGNAFTSMPDITFRYLVGAGGGPPPWAAHRQLERRRVRQRTRSVGARRKEHLANVEQSRYAWVLGATDSSAGHSEGRVGGNLG